MEDDRGIWMVRMIERVIGDEWGSLTAGEWKEPGVAEVGRWNERCRYLEGGY